MPPFPRLSACSNIPSATYVMPSMSRCGCIGQTAPGTSVSSLKTRRSPNHVFSGSAYVSKLKCQRARNQPPFDMVQGSRSVGSVITNRV